MRLVSLDKNLVQEGNFTLLDIIVSKEEMYPDCSTTPKFKIKQARRSVEIDEDVVGAIRQRYGIMPIGVAIRIMLGLKPKIAQNAWQEEEDKLIREYYPQFGSKALSDVLGRKPHCIRDRASQLGIRRKWLYKRDRRKNREKVLA